jgi:hypothetical protein
MIGRGFEGKVFASSLDDKRVIKEIPLVRKRGQRQIDTTTEVMKTIEIMTLASECGVGPELYDIFYNEDRKKIYIEMERVEVSEPTARDVDKIIDLYEKMLRKKFVNFDFQFAKRVSGQKKGEWVMLDFGVSETYDNYREAVQGLIDSDLLSDTGLGYYHPKLQKHFEEKVKQKK